MKRRYDYNDLSGLTFGLLTVEGRAEKVHPIGIREPVRWNCRCICGKYCIHSSTNLTRSNQKEENLISCGCTRKKRDASDLTGVRVGKLLVLGLPIKGGSKSYWKCKCDCGTIKNIRGGTLRDKTTRSCGCLRGSTQSRNNSKKWKGYNEISGEYISSIKKGARKRDLSFGVSGEYLWQLFLSQDKRCALSGRHIQFEPHCTKTNQRTASLDRIDNTVGYIKGNVQWLHKHINKMKFVYEENYFIELCKDVAKYKGE